MYKEYINSDLITQLKSKGYTDSKVVAALNTELNIEAAKYLEKQLATGQGSAHLLIVNVFGQVKNRVGRIVASPELNKLENSEAQRLMALSRDELNRLYRTSLAKEQSVIAEKVSRLERKINRRIAKYQSELNYFLNRKDNFLSTLFKSKSKIKSDEDIKANLLNKINKYNLKMKFVLEIKSTLLDNNSAIDKYAVTKLIRKKPILYRVWNEKLHKS
ncbi:hypothetical protein VQ643_06675 [Pseudomonas sp. F1_0610]|uniref:hypothetical protein n=1 Tax=Pseudomonas sp. F1_0610 TaxID=3114284 RepID=UPI0039C34511